MHFCLPGKLFFISPLIEICNVSFKMKIYVRAKAADQTHGPLGPSAYKTLSLSAQCIYTPDDVLNMLEPFVGHSDIDNIFVEYGDVNIPVVSDYELRIIATCASAYHNSLVRQNFREQKDCYNKSYGEEDDIDLGDSTCTPTLTSATSETSKITESFYSCKEYWDEDVDGDQVVFDASYEMNEDLGQPWLLADTDTQEKYGFYM